MDEEPSKEDVEYGMALMVELFKLTGSLEYIEKQIKTDKEILKLMRQRLKAIKDEMRKERYYPIEPEK